MLAIRAPSSDQVRERFARLAAVTNSRATPSAAHLPAGAIDFAEEFVPAAAGVAAANQQSVLLGAGPLSQGTAAVLTFLTRVLHARAVVEVGTGTGVSGLALFAGMADDGILTSIDLEVDRQAQARHAFVAERIPTQRFRLINGAALEVLPKLRDGAYDMVFINGDRLEYVEYLAQALRLLRHGGVVVLNDALWQGLVADESNDDDETVIIREALASVLETEEFTAVLLPVGGGLLAAVKE